MTNEELTLMRNKVAQGTAILERIKLRNAQLQKISRALNGQFRIVVELSDGKTTEVTNDPRIKELAYQIVNDQLVNLQKGFEEL